MLYERDFRNLTNEEISQLDEANQILKGKGRIITPKDLTKYHQVKPLAAYHYESLFPNNYLHAGELVDKPRILELKNRFLLLLDDNVSERELLRFLKDNAAYFLVAALLNKYFYFGHHAAYAFKEFPLPPNYLVDYLLVGKNSGGYEFVFIELEAPFGDITTKSGELGTTVRKGIRQLEDWDTWIDANFHNLRIVFQKYQGLKMELPQEFYELDKSRIHYVVIAGRRAHFNKKTYRLKRKLQKERNILFLHYDNLLDCVDGLMQRGNY